MTTVFLSGSRSIASITAEPTTRLANIVRKQFDIVVSDSPGADLAFQRYLAAQGYTKVTVYVTGDKVRHNVGDWPVQRIPADLNRRGGNHHLGRDEAMTEVATHGFVVWDGESRGSKRNFVRLAAAGKKALVWTDPEATFFVN